MVPTNDLNIFIEKNDLEFREMVTLTCESLGYPGSPDDVVQDLYLRFLTICDAIALFDQSKALITTYLFTVIRNFIITCHKGHEGSYHRYRILIPSCRDENSKGFEGIVDFLRGSEDYEINAYCNNASNRENQLKEDFDDFKRDLSNPSHNVKFPLRKRNHRIESESNSEVSDFIKSNDISDMEFEEIRPLMESVEKEGCMLQDIFHLLYKGYTNVQISQIYGISTTTVSKMKTRLLYAILEYGILT